ncbi:hypothetical protein AMTR_s00018p00231790, partial [Amborella trichopoda]
ATGPVAALIFLLPFSLSLLVSALVPFSLLFDQPTPVPADHNQTYAAAPAATLGVFLNFLPVAHDLLIVVRTPPYCRL